jgi:hypothetical protein
LFWGDKTAHALSLLFQNPINAALNANCIDLATTQSLKAACNIKNKLHTRLVRKPFGISVANALSIPLQLMMEIL